MEYGLRANLLERYSFRPPEMRDSLNWWTVCWPPGLTCLLLTTESFRESVTPARRRDLLGLPDACTAHGNLDVGPAPSYRVRASPRSRQRWRRRAHSRCRGGRRCISGPGSADPFSPKSVRASAGSVFQIPVLRVESMQTTAGEARSHGLVVRGTAADGDVTLFSDSQTDLSSPTFWMFGNEANGLSDSAKQACDQLVSIPMFGGAESLNVGIAAACAFTPQQGRSVVCPPKVRGILSKSLNRRVSRRRASHERWHSCHVES